ncbi:hypothetical protein CHELA40_13546 [Chelatococcus asaccharovorans]|nr:hypothetical protein CHELA40_13546 [Chelatococcus asaccharovorans]
MTNDFSPVDGPPAASGRDSGQSTAKIAAPIIEAKRSQSTMQSSVQQSDGRLQGRIGRHTVAGHFVSDISLLLDRQATTGRARHGASRGAPNLSAEGSRLDRPGYHCLSNLSENPKY